MGIATDEVAALSVGGDRGRSAGDSIGTMKSSMFMGSEARSVDVDGRAKEGRSV